MAAIREARAVWNGDLMSGSGAVRAVSSGKFADLPVSWSARTEAPGGKTSPEELLAAAHGGCLTMSLASELSKAGTPPGHLEVGCRIVMDEVEGRGHQIVASHVEAIVAIEGIDDDALQIALAEADEGCPFSQLLRHAGVDVHVAARRA